jgi:elongator complex protein 6
MPSQPPLPHLLTPYVSSPPRSSLTTVSAVLGATGNWLILRFLIAALTDAGSGFRGLEEERKRKVVLVSFLRGWEFWRSEAKRLVCTGALESVLSTSPNTTTRVSI